MAKWNLKNKKLIPLVAIACAVLLLIVQAVLLIHYFSKDKEPSKKSSAKPTKEAEEGFIDVEPVPFAEKVAREGYHIVWKVCEEYTIDAKAGKVLTREVVAFDAEGRETWAREHSADGTTTKVYSYYGPFGTKVVKIDEYERTLSVVFTDISGEKYEAAEEYGEYDDWDLPGVDTYSIEIPPVWESDLPERVTWKLSDDAKTITRETVQKHSDDQYEIYETAVITLDEEGRLSRYECHQFGKYPLDLVREYRYEGDITFRTEYRDGKWDVDAQYDERLQMDTYIERSEGTDADMVGFQKWYRPDGRYPFGPRLSKLIAVDYKRLEADGTMRQIYDLELNQYGQPVLMHDIPEESYDYRVYHKFTYDENGHCENVYFKDYYGEYEDASMLVEGTLLVKYDEYGNLIEIIDKKSGEGYAFKWTALEVKDN